MSKKPSILVIEDDPNLRMLYAEVLTQNNFTVQLAEDGQSGLEKLQAGGHDLVLLDVMLPKLSGLDVLHQLKAHPVPPGKPANGQIILMSNQSDETVIQEAEKLGCSTHLIKADITPSILVTQIKKLLS